MRSHDLHGTQQAPLSPAARAVQDRLISGTYEIDLERLAEALLARFEAGALSAAVAVGSLADPRAARAAADLPVAGGGTVDGAPGDPAEDTLEDTLGDDTDDSDDPSLSSAR
jgi:hypothetical protein